MIQNENYDEEINEYNNLENEMNIKEIEDVSDIKNKEIEKEEIDINEKFNLPLTMEIRKNSELKINNEQNSLDEFSLFKDLEDKWLDIEKKKQLHLKKKNNDLLFDSKSNNSTINSLQNWKGIINESRKKYKERKKSDNDEFEKYVKNKMKELKNLTYSNIKTEGNIKYKINSYYDDRKKNYNNNYIYSNNNTSNSGIKSFLKDDDEYEKKFDKIDFLKNNQKKIQLNQQKENKIKNKIKNVFGIITHNKELINNKLNSKYSDLSINELKNNFDEIMGNLSSNYKEKNRIAITRSFKKQNLDNFNSFNNENLSQGKTRNLIEKRLFENKMLLNDLLPESGVGNKKGYTFNKKGNNKKLSSSFSLNITKKNNNKINPIRISNVYGINDFQSISKKCDKINSPTITKLIYY
jgi:peptidyl-prolyl cis-trans isomerase-like 4